MSFTAKMKQVVHSEDVQYDNLFNETGDIQHVAVNLIRVDPHQPRKNFDAAKLRELQKSIYEVGVLQPLLVRENPSEWRKDVSGYTIIAGERRWRAAVACGLLTVPCIVKNVSETDARLLQLVENLQRDDLTQEEEADSYILLMDEYSLPTAEIARRTGKDKSQISRLVNVYRDEALRAAVMAQDVPLNVAAALLPLKPDERVEWLRNVKRDRKRGTIQTPREIADAVAVYLGKAKPKLTDVNGAAMWPVGDVATPKPLNDTAGGSVSTSSHEPEYSNITTHHTTRHIAPSFNISRALGCLQEALQAIQDGAKLDGEWRQEIEMIRGVCGSIEQSQIEGPPKHKK